MNQKNHTPRAAKLLVWAVLLMAAALGCTQLAFTVNGWWLAVAALVYACSLAFYLWAQRVNERQGGLL